MTNLGVKDNDNGKAAIEASDTKATAEASDAKEAAASKAKPEVFDPDLNDAEAAETGRCKELIGEELYMPCHKSRGVIKCAVITDQQGSYRLYLYQKKNKRFLLSAKTFGSDRILISLFEDFPNVDIAPKKGYVASVQNEFGHYAVRLGHCHLCDQALGYLTCGLGTYEREIVARISQTYSKVPINPRMLFGSKDKNYTSLRSFKVTIPTINEQSGRCG